MRAAVLAMAILTGCAAYGDREILTAGKVGCPVSEVKVSDGTTGWSAVTWTARCRSETFYCTKTDGVGTSCTKAL